MARVENGKKTIRKGDFIVREDDNLFVPVLWRGKEIIAYPHNNMLHLQYIQNNVIYFPHNPCL